MERKEDRRKKKMCVVLQNQKSHFLRVQPSFSADCVCVVSFDMNENEHVSFGRQIGAVQQQKDSNESTDLVQMLLVLCCVYKPKEGFESVICLTHWLLSQVAKTYIHSNI